ncbi:MAG TPA: amidase [Chloroflexia bacterium]|nr:amidase [Chloroflexia bacterium]
MNNTELCYTPATELSELLHSCQLSPVELTAAFLERISRLNPLLNAYCTLLPEQALEQARAAEKILLQGEANSPLLGLPVSIKDLILTAGIRTTRGSLLYADYVPEEDAPVVERLKKAGTVILGKTNTPELGWRGTTDNRLFGPSRNPWNPDLTPGGSRGGASAQVAAGLGPLALGTDGGGSIRIPASYTGIFGIKPSLGRVPVYPASATGDLSHVGPMTRTVADAALLLNVLAGPDERDRYSLPAETTDYLEACRQGVTRGLKGLRVAWSPDLGYVQVDPEVRGLTEQATRRFTELGAEVEEVSPGFASPDDIFEVFFYGGITAYLREYLPEKAGLLDPSLREMVEHFAGLTGRDYGKAMSGRLALWDTVRHFFAKYDLLLTPTMPQTAFKVELVAPSEPGEQAAGRLRWTPFTFPFNLTGQPAASIPCGFTRAGMPVGLHIIGRRFADATVIQAAAAYEALQPFTDRRPPLD